MKTVIIYYSKHHENTKKLFTKIKKISFSSIHMGLKRKDIQRQFAKL